MAAQYATTDDLAVFGLGPRMFAAIPVPIQQRVLDAASARADSHLGSRFTLPLTSWGDEIRRAVVHIATLDLLMVRGFNPDDPTHRLVADRAQDALDWLENVSDGNVTPLATDSSTGGGTPTLTDSGGAFVGQLRVIGGTGLGPDGDTWEVSSGSARVTIGTPTVRGW